MQEGTGEVATGVEAMSGVMGAGAVGRMCEMLTEALSWCTRAAEAAEGAVVADRPSRSANSTAYLWAVLEVD